jgi:hypothetical protein
MGWMVNSTPQPFYHHERDQVSIVQCGPQDWFRQLRNFSPPTMIESVDRPAASKSLYQLISADSLLVRSFGSNETTSHPPKHLCVLYRLGVLIGYSARESAVVPQCVMGEISVVATRDTVVLLWDKGAPILSKSLYPRQVQRLPSNLRLG